VTGRQAQCRTRRGQFFVSRNSGSPSCTRKTAIGKPRGLLVPRRRCRQYVRSWRFSSRYPVRVKADERSRDWGMTEVMMTICCRWTKRLRSPSHVARGTGLYLCDRLDWSRADYSGG
jgi:hypothetical protein